jgi:subtilisin family serine protease/sugar lactone lactonase YvrE
MRRNGIVYFSLLVALSTFAAHAVEVPWDRITPEDVFSHELIIGFENAAAAGVTANVNEDIGAQITAVYSSITAQQVSIPAGMTLKEAAAKYKDLPGVRYVEPNYRYGLFLLPNDQFIPQMWGLTRINAEAAWNVSTGSLSVVVAVIDTGIDPNHPEFLDTLVSRTNLYQNALDPVDGIDNDFNGYADDQIGWDMYTDPNGINANVIPLDDHFHGTHVAGTIGAIGDNGGVVGVNWAVQLLSLKIFGPNGAGANGIVQAIDYCTDNNIKVSNNSWGGRFYSQAVYDAIERARAADHLFVAAAGNDSIDNNNNPFPAYPASYDLDNIISVAALAENGALAGFSNYGATTVDIAAPGDQILSSFPSYLTASMAGGGFNTLYGTISGTSMASPHVAGVAALLLSINPSLTYAQLRDSIFDGSVYNPALDGRVAGARELNAFLAVLSLPQQIAFDRDCYQTNAVMTVTIVDGLVVTNNSIGATFFWGTNTMPLTLGRVGTTASFETMVDLTALPPPAFMDEDFIRVVYTNLQGDVISGRVVIDQRPAQILSFHVRSASDTDVEFIWRTDESVDAELFIGTNVPIIAAAQILVVENLDIQPNGSTQFVYQTTVFGLESATRYFAALRVSDCAGNITSSPADLASTNDSDYLPFVTRIRRVVFQTGFDTGPEGWVPNSLTGRTVWEHGVPSFGPFTANSPRFAWGTVLKGRYSHSENAWVESPVFAVEEFPALEFTAWYKLNELRPLGPEIPFPEIDTDFATVEVNNGSGWINITQRSDLLTGQVHFRGDGSAWRPIRIPLLGIASNSTLQVRFRIESDHVGNAPGFYFDDFGVTDVAPMGISIFDIIVNDQLGGDGDGFAEPGESFTLDLVLFNSEFSLTLNNVVADVGSIEEGVTVTIPAGGIPLGTLASSEIVHTGNEIRIQLDPAITDETSATFFLSTTASNGGPYSEAFQLLIGKRESIQGVVTNLFGGTPIAGATVRGTAAGHPDINAATLADGTYKLHGGVPGVEYEVVAFKPGAFSPGASALVIAPRSGNDYGLGQAYANAMPANFMFNIDQGVAQTDLLILDNGAGNISLDYEIEIDYASQITDWLTLSITSGSLATGANVSIDVTVDAESLSAGTYAADIIIKNNDIGGADIVIPVSLTVSAGPVLVFQRVEISGGDGDPFAEPGETNNLVITLANSGALSAFLPLGVLVVDSPTGRVTVVDSFSNWPTLAPQRAARALDPATVALDPGMTDGQVMNFTLNVDEGGNTWVFPFAITSTVRQAISGTVTTITNPVQGVIGARVSARGPVNVDTQVVNLLGEYFLYGLTPGTYEVSVDPPPPYSRPEAQTVVITSVDETNVNFLVGIWDLAAGPNPFPEVFVDEGAETIEGLSITNNGLTAGTVDILIEGLEELPVDIIGDLENVQVAWDTLVPWEDYIPGELLVMYRQFLPKARQEVSLATVGATVQSSFKLIPAVHVKVPLNVPLQQVAAILQAHPDVLLVEPNYRYSISNTPNDPQYPILWGLDNKRQTGGSQGADIGAEALWDRSVGSKSVIVSVHDTGTLLNHPDLEANLWTNPIEVPGEKAPASGVPGVLNFDDDGDALADKEINIIDGLDNDGDGLIDETGIDFRDEEVMRADYNTNGIPLAGFDGIFGNVDDDTNDYPFAILDDDENGYADDIHGYDFGAGDNDPNPDYGYFFPVDGTEHGTHVAGTIGAVGNNNEGVVGVNWETSLMICKISRVEFFFGFPFLIIDNAAIINSLDYAVDNGAKVSNHSYGGLLFSGIQRAGIAAAGAKGHLFVAAAGNSSEDNDGAFAGYPASFNLDNIISVAAADHNDVLAAFSNYGAENVDIAAPGVDVLSTYFREDNIVGIAIPDYELLSGTSMASPHVAGAAALLRSIFPHATVAMLKRGLLEGSRQDERLVPVLKAGGHLDLNLALRAMQPFWLRANPDRVTLAAGGSESIDLIFNAGAHLVEGTYKANVYITEDRNNLRLPVTLHVNAAPAPVLLEVRVIDDVSGDGDGLAEPGETVGLEITVEVQGSALFADPVGVLTSTNTTVVFSDANATWPSMLTGQSRANMDDLIVNFTAAGDIAFNLRLSNGTYGPFDLPFTVPVQPRQSIHGRLVDSQGAGLPDERVEFWGTSSGEVRTDASGNYAIHGLVDGTYKVRALPQAHEKLDPVDVSVAGVDRTNIDLTVRQVAVTPSVRDLVINVPFGQAGRASFTLDNSSSDSFEYRLHEMTRQKIVLISDNSQLSGLESSLTAMGFDVDVHNDNEQLLYNPDTGEPFIGGLYSGDSAIVFGGDLVIADLSGKFGSGRVMTDEEVDVLNEYIGRGGRLILTGANAVSRPDNRGIANLVDGDSLDRDVTAQSLAMAMDPLPGDLFVTVGAGEQVAVTPRKYDIVNSQATVLYAAGGADKLVRRVGSEGGVAYLWGGNKNGEEWDDQGVWLDVLKNIAAAELLADQSWLFATPVAATVGASQQVDVFVDSVGLNEGTYEAVLMVDGNLPGVDTDFIRVTLNVEPLKFTAKSTTGVVDWQGEPLKGNGNAQSALFQVLFAGADGVINPSRLDGSPGGDDQLLKTLLTQLEFSRFGTGTRVNEGLFSVIFEHDLLAHLPERKVYVRAWDASTIANSVTYGDSSLYELNVTAGEQHDFGTWVADIAPDYPSKYAKDINGDSIPNGYYIERGMDPRLPIGPITPAILDKSAFGGVGTVDGKFRFPSKVFVTEKFIVILDTENSRIQVWDRSTEAFVLEYGTTGTGAGQFSIPYGLALNPTQNQFAVLDSGSHRVQIFDFDLNTGAIAYSWQYNLQVAPGEIRAANGLAIGPLGSYYVADTGNDRIQRYKPDGTIDLDFDKNDPPNHPNDGTIGNRGTGNGQFREPQGIAVDQIGRIYVADSGNHRIQVFSGSGKHLSSFGSEGTGAGQFQRPRGIQIGQDGFIYIADTTNSRIQIFNDQRQHIATYSSNGDRPGFLSLPYGLYPAMDSNDLYVADTWNHRIQRFNLVFDGDADGQDDLWEHNNGLENKDASDALIDSDGDGLLNIGEFRINTDPMNADTDGDGLPENVELELGTDPLDSASTTMILLDFVVDATPDATLTFSVKGGSTYRLEFNGDLTDPVGWGPQAVSGLPANPASNQSMTIVLPGVGVDQVQHYRIVESTP